MRVGIVLIVLICWKSLFSQSDTGRNYTEYEWRQINNEAFKKGEKLLYRLHYGFIDAGFAQLEVKDEGKKIGIRQIYHVVGTGWSRGAFDWFYKVRDRYESYIDEEAIMPWLFIRRVNEGGYLVNQDYKFFQHKQIVTTQDKKDFNVPTYIQDMLSAFYFARTINLSAFSVGDTITVKTFLDNELFPLQIKYVGTDTIKVNKGTFSCLKFVPIVQKGRVFKKEEDLMVWITNDKNKIPILAQAKVLVGSIKMEIEEYSGLANPIAVVK